MSSGTTISMPAMIATAVMVDCFSENRALRRSICALPQNATVVCCGGRIQLPLRTALDMIASDAREPGCPPMRLSGRPSAWVAAGSTVTPLLGRSAVTGLRSPSVVAA